MNPPARPQRENLLINIACTIIAPAVVLAQLSNPERLGPVVALVIALAFPIGYGVWDFLQRRKFNFVAGIGFASTLLTGGFALAQVDGIWFAIKEASVPAVIGLMVLLSTKSKRPLVREFIYNDQVIDVSKVDAALAARGARPDFERLLGQAAIMVTLAFLLSAVLNFVLARLIITAPALTEEFNKQVSKMTLWSYVVISLPTMAMMMWAVFRLLAGIKKLTGLELEQVFHAQPEKPAK
ncbi:MAG: MFS transporter [Burkholderiales bacterium]|nr:MFS transporter [Opitutaceae bacterium]